MNLVGGVQYNHSEHSTYYLSLAIVQKRRQAVRGQLHEFSQSEHISVRVTSTSEVTPCSLDLILSNSLLQPREFIPFSVELPEV